MESTGAFVMTSIVIAVNYKLFIATTLHTYWSFLINTLSIASFFVVFLILDNIPSLNDFGTFEMLFVDPNAYFALILFTVSYVLIDGGASFAQK